MQRINSRTAAISMCAPAMDSAAGSDSYNWGPIPTLLRSRTQFPEHHAYRRHADDRRAGLRSMIRPGTAATVLRFTASSRKHPATAAGDTHWAYTSATQHLVHSLRRVRLTHLFTARFSGNWYQTSLIRGCPPELEAPIPADTGVPPSAGREARADCRGFHRRRSNGYPGDWDNGFGYTTDGPYINKA